MRVIEPKRRAAVTFSRPRPLGNRPDIDVAVSGSDGIILCICTACSIQVCKALRILLVEHTVRVQTIRPGCMVSEDHLDCVAYLGADQRPEDAEMDPIFRPRLGTYVQSTSSAAM